MRRATDEELLSRLRDNIADIRDTFVHDYVVYSGPGVFAEAEHALPALEAAAVELADAMNRAKARKT
jgi:uncharacterized protein with HEPN domain